MQSTSDWHHVGVLLVVLLTVLAINQTSAATRTQPTKDHRWQVTTAGRLTTAIAQPCTECAADLMLSCLARGRGLMRLTLPVASVANGRPEASKQIRLIIDRAIQPRRAITIKTARGYTPVIDLAVDDPMLDALSRASLLELGFYGQRSFVGLANAATAITQVRTICQSGTRPVPARHCTWSITVSCSPQHKAAEAAANDVPAAFVRKTRTGYCAVIAISDLALAKARAAKLGARLERSCLP
jgi:hypothetical protein